VQWPLRYVLGTLKDRFSPPKKAVNGVGLNLPIGCRMIASKGHGCNRPVLKHGPRSPTCVRV